MRTVAQNAFGKVAIGTQHLIAGRVALRLEQLIQGRSHQSALAMLRAVVLDVVQLQELRDGLSAARAHRPAVSIECSHLEIGGLGATAFNAVLALLVAFSARVAADAQIGGDVLGGLFAPLLLADFAAMQSASGKATARFAVSARQPLVVGYALTLSTDRALESPRITGSAARCTNPSGLVSLAASLFDSVTFFIGLARHGSNPPRILYHTLPGLSTAGDVCEGGGNCRCERVSDYDLAAWRGLAGE